MGMNPDRQTYEIHKTTDATNQSRRTETAPECEAKARMARPMGATVAKTILPASHRSRVVRRTGRLFRWHWDGELLTLLDTSARLYASD